jgi:hypothetical protein
VHPYANPRGRSHVHLFHPACPVRRSDAP